MNIWPRHSGLLKRFTHDRTGNMIIMSALAMPVIIGCAGLALEYGSAVAMRAENQRISDLAAYTGAVTYAHQESESRMRAAALEMVALNGGNPANATVNLVPSPLDPEALGVRVVMTGTQPTLLSAILNGVLNIEVAAGATAIVGSKDEGTAACIVALDTTQSGITLSGGTRLNAPECDVSSNSVINAPCGTAIAAKKVTYADKLNHCIWDNNVKETVAQETTSDPFVDHAGIAAAWARVSSVDMMEWPLKPPHDQTGGKDVHFQSGATQANHAHVQQSMPSGCKATWSNPRWSVDCSAVPANSEIRFGSITVSGSVKLEIDHNSSVKRRYFVNGKMEITGSGGFESNGGKWTIRDGIRIDGSTSATFGSGEYIIGSGYHSGGGYSCSGNKYSVCVQGSGKFIVAGPSSFDFGYGIRIEGNTIAELGSGNGNSYHFGNPVTNLTSVYVSGSSRLRTANVSKDSGFKIKGDVTTTGGSCIWFGEAPQHDVDGSMSFGGGVYLGAGMWTINGGFTLGANGGGNVSNCFGQDISLRAENVTLVLSGKGVKSSGSCGNAAFCATAGYRNVTLTASQQGPTAGIAIIGPQTPGIKNGALFAAGASSAQVSGAFYFPNGPLDMTGGAGIGGGSGRCFQVVATRVTLSGGTTAASNCVMNDDKGSGGNKVSVRLVR